MKTGRRLTFLAAALLLASLCFNCAPVIADTFREALSRGQTLQAEGDDEGAINSFMLASSLAPTPFNDARLSLVRLYAKLGRYAEAESEWQQILSHTKDLGVRHEYGQFLIEQGKFSTAMVVWNDIINEYPNDGAAFYYMGLCAEGTGDFDSSLNYYQKAYTLAPNTGEGMEAKIKLSRLNKFTKVQGSGKYFPVDPDLGQAGLGWWNLKRMPLHVYIDDGAGVPGYRAEMRGHVIRALEVWSQGSHGHFQFVLDPPDPQNELAWKYAFFKATNGGRKLDFGKLPDDPIKSQIHVHWEAALPGALGIACPSAYVSFEQGRPDRINKYAHLWIASNIKYDGTSMPSTYNAANTSLLERQDRMIAMVSIHEMGHVLGLPHSNNPRDIMCGGVFAFDSSDVAEESGLSVGDLTSLAEHYNNFEGTGIPADLLAAGKKYQLVMVGRKSGPSNRKWYLPGHSVSEEKLEEPEKPVVVLPRFQDEINSVVFDIDTKNYAQGLTTLEKVLKSDPKNLAALYLRGVVLVYTHKYDDAARSYQEVMKISPGSDYAKRAADGLKKIKTH